MVDGAIQECLFYTVPTILFSGHCDLIVILKTFIGRAHDRAPKYSSESVDFE